MKRLLVFGIATAIAFFGAYGIAGACCGPTEPAPEIFTASCTPNVLWPPNHKYVTVEVALTTNTGGRWEIMKVTSDQPDDADGVGDGKTVDDILIVSRGPQDPDNPQPTAILELRAERCGAAADEGFGRSYAVLCRAWTDMGSTYTTETIYVPHNMSGE